MKIIQISPGSGDNFYCENCLRDAALVRAMRTEGHDVLMVPLYLPLQADKDEPVSNAPIFFGGVNVYLQQKLALFRKTPRWIDKLFDSRALLEWAGHKAGMTNARDLGETTISMLQGAHGRQVKELDRLVEWLGASEDRTDVVCLSNILLGGLVGHLKERLNVPVVCLLQDEDDFLDGLTSPYAERAWDIVRQCARQVDAFVAVSQYYGDAMTKRLAIDPSRVHVVHMGIDVDTYPVRQDEPVAPTIGFLSRMCPERGLDTLVDAFIALKKNEKLENAKLRVSGGRSAADEPFIKQMQSKLARAGLEGDAEFLSDFDRRAKLDFLEGLSVLSVPEKRPVAYGLYVLEALATGVPVVEPAIGCFPEMIERTGGGVLYEPNTVEELVKAIEPLLLDPREARRLGIQGREGVHGMFRIEKSAREMTRFYEKVVKS